MKYAFYIFFYTSIALFSCQQKRPDQTLESSVSKFQNKGHELIYQMTQKVGSYQDLLNKKDVIYTYTYKTPDGKTDVSTEQYIFDGELSRGTYHQHERTLPDLKGTFTQGYNGEEFWVKQNDVYLEDEAYINKAKFNRKTNFYWFAMFQKLLDPGLIYEYLGESMLNEKTYDVVKITFNSENNKPTDIYQVYINKATSLVDQFLFTVVDYGLVETPLLMQVEYQNIDGLLIPNKRQYKKSTWEAEVSESPWIHVEWTDIKFDNGLSRSDFSRQ